MRLGHPDTVTQYNFANSTIQDGVGGHLENSKNCNISAIWMDQF